MATIKDVARLAGVSVATVSRVINNSPKASDASRQAVNSRHGVIELPPECERARTGAAVNGNRRSGGGRRFRSFFWRHGQSRGTGRLQHRQFFADWQRLTITKKKSVRPIEQLIRHRCAALVVHAKLIPDAELAGLMKQIPGMVLINRILPGFEKRCVALDDRYGAWLATRPSDSAGAYANWLYLLESRHFGCGRPPARVLRCVKRARSAV
ncbi:Galactose operon repressor [Kluyvera cryocrescens]|uniref:Galactose operon repressor n=1 Tax=Kluyvera cryocrescens TaxID=580 RepID=A0A485ARI4_KLUCR|nr:Galactose operon repressor [Kluyvera cryocrescens]